MKFEFVEFGSLTDFLVGVNAYFSAPGIRPFVPLDLYKGYLMHMAPLASLQDDTVTLVFITKTVVQPGVVEFDPATKSHSKVDAISRPDKLYFVVIEPKLSTIADQALEAYLKLADRKVDEGSAVNGSA
ncbi:MAG: hypothetical protein QW767_03240 [Thermoprotei archaeon]